MNEQQCQAAIVEALTSGQGFPEAVDDVKIVETHISWVFLAGEFAYKIKKAIKLNYLDFTGADNRRRLCEDELQLNRRWAPDIYLDVLPIGGSSEAPQIGAVDTPIEYVLRMRRFPQSDRLDRQLESGNLGLEDTRVLAETVANLHLTGQSVPFEDAAKAIRRAVKPIEDNYPHVARVANPDDLERVRSWTDSTIDKLSEGLVARHQDGFVREGHGDLHLANLVRLGGGIAAFDCVEFSAELRNIDVISDSAFLVMDLAVRDREDLAYAFLNRYLELTGDYAGMVFLDLYVVYHCMIRAKVAAIRGSNRNDDVTRLEDEREVETYMKLALAWIERPAPRLVAMRGFSGSGKTWVSDGLAQHMPAIRVRTDVERKRKLGIAETAATGSGVGEGVYTLEARSEVYGDVLSKARTMLESGHNVIVDATMLNRSNRDRVAGLSAELGVPWVIVDTQADDTVLEERLGRRETLNDDSSEAGLAALEDQRRYADLLDSDELRVTIRVNTGANVEFASLAKSVLDHDIG